MINSNVIEKIPQYSEFYLKNGWVSIPDFYEQEFAESIYTRLSKETEWEMATLKEGRPFVVKNDEFRQQSPEVQQSFVNEILNYARTNDFQYLYEYIRLLGDDSSQTVNYEDVKKLCQNETYIEHLCKLTSLKSASFFDAQLTRYTPGCFLTQHCDTRIGENSLRHAAIVISLSKNWRADFGGLLNIQNDQGEILKTFTPQFNTLNILSIPFQHFVSQVANYTPYFRYSLIGWLWKDAK